MKHLKTFESFNTSELEKVDEAFGYSEKEKEAELRTKSN